MKDFVFVGEFGMRWLVRSREGGFGVFGRTLLVVNFLVSLVILVFWFFGVLKFVFKVFKGGCWIVFICY